VKRGGFVTGNEAFMRHKAQQTRTPLRVLYHSNCSTGPKLCAARQQFFASGSYITAGFGGSVTERIPDVVNRKLTR
jgi:hypothetical protein